MFVLNSEIVIGKFKFSGVNEVNIKRSIHSLVDTAIIKIPAMSRILKKDGKNINDVVTASRFNTGDEVIIKLGYDGDLKEEFRGFVNQVNQNSPLEIECEGYSYQLKKQTVFGSWSKIKLNALMQEIVKNTGIKVDVDANSNIDITSIQGGKTAFEMIDIVLKAAGNGIEAWFIEPDVLKVGFIYVPGGDEMKDVLAKPQVKYRIGYNALQDNNLKVKMPGELKVLVKNAANKRDRNTDVETEKKIKVFVLNKMPAEALKKIEDALKLKESYKGYEGKLSGFLKPLCFPGFKAFITDSRYKDRDGDYFIESVEVNFGVNGARRIVEVGPKLSTT